MTKFLAMEFVRLWSWNVKEFKMLVDFLLLPMGGSDLILGLNGFGDWMMLL